MLCINKLRPVIFLREKFPEGFNRHWLQHKRIEALLSVARARLDIGCDRTHLELRKPGVGADALLHFLDCKL